MIKTTYSLNLSHNHYEYDPLKTDDLDYAVYLEQADLYLNKLCPLHWHRELEFYFVIDGSISVTAGVEEFTLSKNEGVFMNTNVLHSYRGIEDGSITASICFDPAFICGNQTQNSIYTKYLLPLLQNTEVSHVILSPAIRWQKDILNCCNEVLRLAKQEDFGYELFIRSNTATALITLIEHLDSVKDENVTYSDDASTVKMVQYIVEHFSEKVAVEDIAKAGNVSSRDCYRRFQKLNTTPLHYLETVRFINATEMLTKGNDTVAEIAIKCGFVSPSYFGKKFKEFTGTTPASYREKHKT